MRRKWFVALITLLALAGLVALFFLVFYQPPRPANVDFTNVKPVRAMRVDYLDMGDSRGEVARLETQMKRAGVNMMAVSAGRVDWTYFPWSGHSDRWSSEVKKNGIDYLAQDSSRFGKWAHVSAVVDVLAPLYIQAHPETAAISWSGEPSQHLVSTMELVDGKFGQDLIDLIDKVAADYPVNSVLITELVYYVDGFGENDKAAYLAYSGMEDWPRTAGGQIDITDPNIGKWRSYEIGRFLEKAGQIVHLRGKQLIVEGRVSLGADGNVLVRNGTDFNTMLKYADRLVVWGNHDLDGNPIKSLGAVGQYLKSNYGQDRVLLMIGLWKQTYAAGVPNNQMSAITADDLRTALEATRQSDSPGLWITPSFLMSDAHWQVLDEFWSTR